MAKTCAEWQIPYVNISEIPNSQDIKLKIDEVKPKVILASIESVSQEEVQSCLQRLDISYVAVDECQVNQSNGILSSKISFIRYWIL